MAEAYSVGNWTQGALKTLQFINNENLKGKNPKIKDFPSGTYINWVYVLKKGGYVQNGDGFALIEQGKALLKELELNPPQRKGGKRPKPLKIERAETQKADEQYRIIIQGKDLAFEKITDKKTAKEIMLKLM